MKTDSYSQSFNQVRPDIKVPEDKNAYLTFLEIQLEKISQSWLSMQSNNDLIKSLNSKVNLQEEKIVNISRLVKLL